ncbi:MAG: hypothetical protein WB706_06900, partial [Nitrososphaeraceae archaeon]
DKTDNGCDAIKSEKNKDESKKTSTDETQRSITRSQAEIDNSTLPIDLESENPFALVGMNAINSTTE